MPVERIRVLIANIPDMLSEILASELGGDREIELLISRGEEDFLSGVGRFHPDVVIAGSSGALASCMTRLRQVYLLSPSATRVRRIELRSISEDMGDVSLSQLVAAIKEQKEH